MTDSPWAKEAPEPLRVRGGQRLAQRPGRQRPRVLLEVRRRRRASEDARDLQPTGAARVMPVGPYYASRPDILTENPLKVEA